ncbi:RHS repeat domain-containing protein [Ralstonia solanacearum]|uniref:RHS repeat domain-containing protein n=1 Tax=Ralstonia solanacearum TaxID=305 RepID=UPI001E41FFED|nr:hypothetical protein [Ralstonia solanacearum]
MIENYSRIEVNSCDPQSFWLDAVGNRTSQVVASQDPASVRSWHFGQLQRVALGEAGGERFIARSKGLAESAGEMHAVRCGGRDGHHLTSKASIGHGGAMGARASSFFYETDAENRIVSLLEAGREGLKPHWYRYDAADRLLADDSRNWSDRRYSYDAADNRTSATSRTAKQTIVPNALNQMQTVNGQPTQYDAAGNLNLLEDEARQYDWDAEHRLIRIRYKAQAGKETRFGYDGLGRWTVITEVDGTGTTETHYVRCGEAICQNCKLW